MPDKERSYRILKEEIMNLTLKPGEILSELKLSARLRISRTPIREILMRLKNEFLIEVKPQSGTFVSLIDRQLIDEALFARVILEKAVVKEAIRMQNPSLIPELKENLRLQHQIESMPERESEFHQLDLQFHRLFFEKTDKLHLWKSLQDLSTHYNRMRQLIESKGGGVGAIVQQHESLVRLIAKGKTDAIDAFYESHVVTPSFGWDSQLNEHPELRRYIKEA